MPPPPELQQIPQQAVRTTRSGRAGTLAQGDSQYEDDGDDGDTSGFIDANGQVSSGPSADVSGQGGPGNKKGKWATSDTVDWQRKRKDNHVRVCMFTFQIMILTHCVACECRKKSSADGGVISTKASTSWPGWCQMWELKRPRVQFSLARCVTLPGSAQ